MKRSKIFVIVQDDGELYCAADSHEHAQQIIDEDSDNLSHAFIVKLDLWSEAAED